tara:strand:- start:78 stop:416 length:339 start_codon:yes stop_codon:yes gene_type:complete
MAGPFKMKGYTYPGKSPMKQKPSVQDNTRTKKAKKITLPKFDADNAWITDQDKYQHIGKEQYVATYNDVVKSYKGRGYSDEHIQTTLNKRLKKADRASSGRAGQGDQGYFDR